jgi:glycosyltransferase involved in cell wall biosynthesis
MRIIWSSNSPFVGSGYGMQTAIACRRLRDMGHDVSIFAFWGLAGSRVDWGDIPIYPNNPGDWGIKHAPLFYDDCKADILITLVDVWVLRELDPKMNWVPWFPVDHNPPPPQVVQTLRQSAGLIKPIAMSKFGQEGMQKLDIETYYIPHTVNTNLFKPMPEWDKVAREKYNWEDKFVIGTVATNHIERKNWVAGMKAVAEFEKKHPGEVIYYMHTNPLDERGINLLALREALGIEGITKFPSQAEMVIGIEMETMARMYNTLDVFLLPTKGEGFGIPLIEAQACGVPVITTDCTAQTELFGGGWLIKDLIPTWTAQSSWQFDCHPEEIVELLEKAYQAKKNGSIVKEKKKARGKVLEYDEDKVFTEYWPPVLNDISDRLKQPRNLEGVQGWRMAFIPQTCLPRKVLDVGCGVKQPYRERLSALGEYVGVDLRNGKNPDIVIADAHNLPFGDKEFGFVWCSELLEHADNPKRVVEEAKRVGKHGVILFSTPENQFFRMDASHKVVKGVEYTTVHTGDGCILW